MALLAPQIPPLATQPRRPAVPSWPRSLGALAAGLLLGIGSASAQAPTVIDVVAGDTFSAIAAKHTGNTRSWAQLYDPALSGLADPNRITPGMRFELVSEAGGKRYLKLVSGGGALASAAKAKAAAAAAPAPAPAPAASPAPAPAPAPVVAAATPVPAAADELVVGVLPNIGAAALLAQYQSLKNYLERQGNTQVRIVVPANFKAFFDSTVRGEYDLAVAAPHFARVAQVDNGLVPLAMYEPRIGAQYITTLEAPLASPKDVKGKAVAFANPTSLVALYGLQWFRGQGLEPGKDFEIKGARTDMGVGRMLLTGEVVAAVMSTGEFRALPAEESGRLKIAEVFARIPNFILLGNPKLGKDKLARLKTQLLAFLADKEDGVAFAKATNFSGIVEPDEATLRELDPYMAPTRRAMGVGQ